MFTCNNFTIHLNFDLITPLYTFLLNLDDDLYELNYFAEDSASNHSACRMPKLLVDDPSLSDFMEKYDPLNCSSMKNWVYTADGKFYIDSEADKKYGPIVCTYYDIKQKSESEYDHIPHANFKNGNSVIGNGFRVICKGKTNAYVNATVKCTVHFTVSKINVSEKLLPKPSKTLLSDMHIFIFLLDSMSRINFLRKLPKFYEFLIKEMNGLDMQSFNIVGDGTPWAVIPLTTCHYEHELSEGRKRFTNSSFLDNWPLIFKDFKKAGYGSAFGEEQAAWNAFTLRFKGFDKEPVDHYLR